MMSINEVSLENFWYAVTIERQECGVIRGEACVSPTTECKEMAGPRQSGVSGSWRGTARNKSSIFRPKDYGHMELHFQTYSLLLATGNHMIAMLKCIL
jgi:hypothetical protein